MSKSHLGLTIICLAVVLVFVGAIWKDDMVWAFAGALLGVGIMRLED
jgi:hypothetical protein